MLSRDTLIIGTKRKGDLLQPIYKAKGTERAKFRSKELSLKTFRSQISVCECMQVQRMGLYIDRNFGSSIKLTEMHQQEREIRSRRIKRNSSKLRKVERESKMKASGEQEVEPTGQSPNKTPDLNLPFRATYQLNNHNKTSLFLSLTILINTERERERERNECSAINLSFGLTWKKFVFKKILQRFWRQWRGMDEVELQRDYIYTGAIVTKRDQYGKHGDV